MQKEQLIHKVKFSKRILFIDILFLIMIISVVSKLNPGKITPFLLLFVFLFILYKTLKDGFRIFFHKVYITKSKVIYQKGYYPRWIKSYNLNEIIGVYFKSSFFDRHKFMTTFKILLSDNRKFFLKNVLDGYLVADILSKDLKKQNEMNVKKYNK